MTIDPTEIAALQTELTALWHQEIPAADDEGFRVVSLSFSFPTEDAPLPAGKEFLQLVAENHLRNFELWHEEDVARRDDLGSERVHQAKRAIDRYNQQRNNFIEEMDKLLVASLQPAESGCPKNSETPGMIIDRLSILALKEFHMREETVRTEVSDAHRATCSEKLARIVLQRGDLTQSLAELLDDVAARRRTFAVYYQFKMYNDPALNPQLYGAAKP
jgi:hypothetical protein